MSQAAISMVSSSPNLELRVEGEERFDVREFSLEEGLSMLFSIEIVAASDNPGIDFEEIVGKDASFKVSLDPFLYPGNSTRTVTGVVAEVQQLHSEPTGVSTYHLTIHPKAWLLTQRQNCRIYQQMTDLAVVKSLLEEWGLEFKDECTRSYKSRKCRVQYQESDFAFISRLLEATGVTYLFRQEGDKSILVLRDAPERGELREASLDHTSAPNSGDRYATNFRASRAVRPGKIVFADNDPRLPNEPLTGEASASSHAIESKLEFFSYKAGAFKFGGDGPKDTPVADDRGRHRTDPNEAKRIAEEDASARKARSQRFHFESNHLDLVAGERVKVGRHVVAEKMGELLVVRVSMSGTSETDVTVSCDAVSASQPFRPEAVTAWPSIHGIENAVVVGPAGETIHCDEFGRVRIQFHWDRYGKHDENSSVWVPVNQPWAGSGMGAINIPRIGQEVMVSFLGGNPEEPMIVGRMFTNLLRPPFPLPGNKTQNGFKSGSVPATGGYNELMFEDAAGSELVRIRAEKDMATRVNNNQALNVGKNRSSTIDKDDKEVIKGNQRNQVIKNMVSSVGADKLTSVLGNLISAAGKQRVFQTLGNFVSDALTHKISSKMSTTISVGASSIHIGPDSIIIQTPKLFLNPGQEAAKATQLTGKAPTSSEGS